jgi:hypothetical protein
MYCLSFWGWSKYIVFAVFEVPKSIVYWNEIEHLLVLPLKNIQPVRERSLFK